MEFLVGDYGVAVIGIGSASSSAINLVLANYPNVFTVITSCTNVETLEESISIIRLPSRYSLTIGMETLSDPQSSALAIQANLENILNVVKGSDHIFIMAGLGGETGTGAASIVGQACKELGILTVAVVTFPSQAEGESRTERAEEELSALLQVVDTVVIIPIDSVISDVQSKTHLDAAERANYLMREVVRTFLDIIIRPPIGPRIDFADLRSATRERGLAIMGTGIANGEKRGEIAAKQAISCFYSNNIPLNSARCVLITVATDQNASLHELEEIITIFQEELSDESDVFVGMCLNPSLEDAFRVTCIGSDIAMIDRRWRSLAAPSTRDACSNWESEDTGNFKKPVFTGLGRIFQRQSRRAAITPQPKKSTFLSKRADLASNE